MMKMYDIWMEGFIVTGQSATARYLGKYPGNTFAEACESWAVVDDDEHLFNKESLTYWGCQLYDNEIDARRFFG